MSVRIGTLITAGRLGRRDDVIIGTARSCGSLGHAASALTIFADQDDREAGAKALAAGL